VNIVFFKGPNLKNKLVIKRCLMLFLFVLLLISIIDVNANEGPQRFQKIIYIVFENQDFKKVIEDPYFKQITKKGALFANFYAETHPSQPNYIAMIAGDTLGVSTNNKYTLNEGHLGDLLERVGRKWRVYAEDYPGNCFLGASSAGYARKHVPFLSFKNVQENNLRCQNIVNFENFQKDLLSQNLVDFNMIIPNGKNSGHDSNVVTAAAWLKKTFSQIIEDRTQWPDTLLVISFDEGSYNLDNQIYTVVVGASVRPNSLNQERHDHYSLLNLIETEWNLGSLSRKDAGAKSILNIWN
jgi:hypothetical protein